MSADSCLLQISRENFFRRISNLESWEMYSEKAKAKKNWRKQRLSYITKNANIESIFAQPKRPNKRGKSLPRPS